jgi:pimeloyl-ACP methyl ester carboxylesterase
MVSICNGVIGDSLARRGHDLSLAMTLLDGREPLTTRATEATSGPRKVVLLVHGLAFNEQIWQFPGEPGVNYGALLQGDLGYAPFFVRYNSGLHIYENGRQLAQLLHEQMARQGGMLDDADELVLIGHSMGGLVVRSACHYGQQQGLPWVGRLRKVVYLGTPHQGAPLERWGKRASARLAARPPRRFQWLARLANLRSNGIKDLGDGRFVDVEASHRRPGPSPHWAERGSSWAAAPPLLPTAAHYDIAGSVTEDPDHPLARYLGDMLIPVPCGRRLRGPCPPEQTRVFPGVHHNRLAHDREVYECIRSFLGDG